MIKSQSIESQDYLKNQQMFLTIELKNRSINRPRTTYARSLSELDSFEYIYLIQSMQYLRSITKHGKSDLVQESVHFIFHQIHKVLETKNPWEPLEDLDWQEYKHIVVDTQAYGGLDFIRIDITWEEVTH